MSETPRTDAACVFTEDVHKEPIGWAVVSAEVAKQMEKELRSLQLEYNCMFSMADVAPLLANCHPDCICHHCRAVAKFKAEHAAKLQ